MKQTGLGRGLSALLPEADSKESVAGVQIIPASEIHSNPMQPRREFRQDELDELAASIRSKGIIQPLVVRKRPAGGFELVAGERRLRAAQQAGFLELPVRIIEVTNDKEMLELALVENLQREDLNPVDLAKGYQHLAEDYGLTQEQIADQVGKNRATVANTLRILDLPEPIIKAIRSGDITMGHAKAILMLQGAAWQSALFKKVQAGKLSVRQTEDAAKALLSGNPEIPKPPKTVLPSSYTPFVDRLRNRLGTQVKIIKRGKKGAIRIEFYSDEDLERLMELLEKR